MLWDQLNEHTTIDIVEPVIGLKLANLCLKRNSYINRVFELEIADSAERIIVKFYRPGRWSELTILAEHQFLQLLAEQEIPVIPPLTLQDKTLFETDGIFFTIFPKKGGRAMDEFDADMWRQVGRLIGRIHLLGKESSLSNQMTQHRLTWLPSVVTARHLETILSSHAVPPDYEKSLIRVTNQLIQKATAQFKNIPLIPLHGDCHKGNLIFRPGEGVYLIDFDDMVVGPAIQDMWMLLPDELDACELEINYFIEGYETFFPFSRKFLDLIPILQGMRLIHFAAWCAIQKEEAHFQDVFPHWGTTRYWNETIKSLQEIVLS